MLHDHIDTTLLSIKDSLRDSYLTGDARKYETDIENFYASLSVLLVASGIDMRSFLSFPDFQKVIREILCSYTDFTVNVTPSRPITRTFEVEHIKETDEIDWTDLEEVDYNARIYYGYPEGCYGYRHRVTGEHFYKEALPRRKQIDRETRTEIIQEPGNFKIVPVGQFHRQIIEPCSDHLTRSLVETRNYLWRFGGDQLDREVAIRRINAVKEELPSLLIKAINAGILSPDITPVAVYLNGSYPWQKHPNDLDLFILLPGTGRPTISQLSPCTITNAEPTREDTVEIEVAHSVTLKNAAHISHGCGDLRLFLRFPLLYSSPLLAGEDQFKTTPPSTKSELALWEDLLRDRDRHRKNSDKYRWRQIELDCIALSMLQSFGIEPKHLKFSFSTFRLLIQLGMLKQH